MRTPLVLIAILCSFVSCVKDKNTREPLKLIKREVSYRTSNPLIKSVRLFTYDANKRCIEIKLGIIDSSVINPVFNLRHTVTFGYNNSSSQMPSTLSSVLAVFPEFTTIYYYNYNSKGLKSRDSVRLINQEDQPADKVVHYTYTNDRAFVTPVLTGFPMENNSLDTLLFSKAGNISKLTSRLIRSGGDQITTLTFTYDQSVNPYNKLNIANSLYFQSSSIGLGYNVPIETHYIGGSVNNYTSWTGAAGTATYKYEYDMDKYPVRKEYTLPGGASPFQITTFEY